MSVAQIIYQQLGGSRFQAMTGASSFSGFENTLSFKLPKGRGVRITLNGKDLYDITFLRMRKFEVETVATRNDVDCEALKGVMEELTGLALSL